MPIITKALQATEAIKDGASLMFGGFMAVGTPPTLVEALLRRGVKDLTVICNDSGFMDQGTGKLVCEHRVARLIASHIGTNPETGRQMVAGEMEVTLIPQGSLAEKIRAGGAGLGGILTPTGLGTVVEEGKDIIEVEGREYLLELPLRADFALLHAKIADRAGNLIFHGTMRTFNTVMAMAADTVIAEADEIIEDAYLNPDAIHIPGILVDILVKKGEL